MDKSEKAKFQEDPDVRTLTLCAFYLEELSQFFIVSLAGGGEGLGEFTLASERVGKKESFWNTFWKHSVFNKVCPQEKRVRQNLTSGGFISFPAISSTADLEEGEIPNSCSQQPFCPTYREIKKVRNICEVHSPEAQAQ